MKENEVSSEDVEKNVEKPYKSRLRRNRARRQRARRNLDQLLPRPRPQVHGTISCALDSLPSDDEKRFARKRFAGRPRVHSLIESGFSPRAHSHSNAVGYWQFIRGTGRRFGLKVDPFIDERRDPVLSTRAAAEYFKALYGLFGSWHLAMAAYNVGENRVKRAVTHYYTKIFGH